MELLQKVRREELYKGSPEDIHWLISEEISRKNTRTSSQKNLGGAPEKSWKAIHRSFNSSTIPTRISIPFVKSRNWERGISRLRNCFHVNLWKNHHNLTNMSVISKLTQIAFHLNITKLFNFVLQLHIDYITYFKSTFVTVTQKWWKVKWDWYASK